MNETSRKQGRAIMGGALFVGLLFTIGILQGSYWAIAIPVAILTFFALGLIAWVGHTIATVQVEAEPPMAEAPAPEPQPEPEPLRDVSSS